MTESRNDVRPQVPTTSIAEWPDAEVFLLTAFRCWLAGYETGDIACWELAWQGVSRKRPLADAKRIIAELGQFTRVFRQTLTCRFVYLPYCCGRIYGRGVPRATAGGMCPAGKIHRSRSAPPQSCPNYFENSI
jgi:hypothetical protein